MEIRGFEHLPISTLTIGAEIQRAAVLRLVKNSWIPEGV